MKMEEYIKQEGEFLKAKHVDESPTKIFVPIGEGNFEENKKFGGFRYHIKGNMDGKEYTFDMSKTNTRTVAEAIGTETKKWVGVKILLQTYKTKTSDGKMVDAIDVKGIDASH